uniref:Uncharacterized protein n=2 Tax=Meloidogyne TaxID=189290 RepID=A0A6V7VVU2_MELEN|nr:unnamed protein product [Meloidogyne enterolobii]
MKLILVFLFLFAFLEVGMGLIRCKLNGHCTGSGNPDINTRCKICYSCTYKGCCHWIYTFVNVCCKIPGWRHPAYQKRFCNGI